MDNQNFIYYLIFGGLLIIHKGNSKKILPRDNKLFFVRKETFGRKYILTSKQEWEKNERSPKTQWYETSRQFDFASDNEGKIPPSLDR